MDQNHRERLFRGDKLDQILGKEIAICGVGALGSHLAQSLAHIGFMGMTLIDFDRVETPNVSTQVYGLNDIGTKKVAALQGRLMMDCGVPTTTYDKKIDRGSVRGRLRAQDLVVDCFDNSEARQVVTDFCESQEIPCLHLGVADGFGQVEWNEGYRVPAPRDDGDDCENPMARNLAVIVASIGAEEVMRFLLDGKRPKGKTWFDLGSLQMGGVKI